MDIEKIWDQILARQKDVVVPAVLADAKIYRPEITHAVRASIEDGSMLMLIWAADYAARSHGLNSIANELADKFESHGLYLKRLSAQLSSRPPLYPPKFAQTLYAELSATLERTLPVRNQVGFAFFDNTIGSLGLLRGIRYYSRGEKYKGIVRSSIQYFKKGFQGRTDREIKNRENPGPRLSPAQERRAIGILLDNIPEKVWAELRGSFNKAGAASVHFGVGIGIRNCLRMHGFLDNESPTGNLDDVSDYLAIKAAAAAKQKDFVGASKKLPARRMRPDIQGSPRVLGEKLWAVCSECSEWFWGELMRVLEGRRHSFEKKKPEVIREVTIVTMWIISVVRTGDKDALEAMHDCFFLKTGIADERNPANPVALRDINERYNFFFKAMAAGSPGSFLTCLLDFIIKAGGSVYVDAPETGLMASHYQRTIGKVESLS